MELVSDLLGDDPESKAESGGSSATNQSLKLPPVIDGKNFKFLRSETSNSGGQKLVALCLNCNPAKEVCGNTKSTGNFLLHMKRLHEDHYESYKKLKVDVPSSQRDLKHLITGVTKGSQKAADKAILNYVVHSMLPLSTVENPQFKILVQELTQDKNVKVMTRRALDTQLREKFLEITAELRAELGKGQYICLTADCWSTHARSFLGVTAHWINDNLQRESRTLSCMRFKGTHSYDRIAQRLKEVIDSYKLARDKVVSVVTDNGSNFCKAFREFSIPLNDEDTQDQEIHSEVILPDDIASLYLNGSTGDEAGEDEDDDDGALFHENINITMKQKKHDITLPPHFRCISHTLSLVSTTDLNKTKDRRLYHKVMGKCSRLWNLSTSPKSAEIIVAECGQNFLRPVPTRWNSLYKAVDRLLKMKNGIPAVCDSLGIPQFTDAELNFLQEFALISAPVAIALNEMQGEKGLFMGSVLPTLRQLLSLLEDLRPKAKLCEQFLDAYIGGIRDRFATIMIVNPSAPSDLVLAAMSHPFFKLRWIETSHHDELKKSFIRAAANFFVHEELKKPQDSNKHSFYNFKLHDDSSGPTTNMDNIELQCLKYFNDESLDLDMLHRHVTIKKMFMKYNTPLPSSAPVERLFSYGGLIMSAKRSRLSDKKFEELIMIKSNDLFKSESK